MTITLERHGPLLELRVADEGPGVSSEYINQIFEPFHKINEARTTDGSGLGLGLPLVKRIAQIHNGNITVTSAPGKGSTFHLVLHIHNDLLNNQDVDLGDDPDETATFTIPISMNTVPPVVTASTDGTFSFAYLSKDT